MRFRYGFARKTLVDIDAADQSRFASQSFGESKIRERLDIRIGDVGKRLVAVRA